MSFLPAAVFVVVAAGDFEPVWGDDDYTDVEESDPSHSLRGHALPSVLDLSGVSLDLEVHGFEGIPGEVLTPVLLRGMGDVVSPLEGEVTDVSFAISIVPGSDVDRVHHRLTAPPLKLTQQELDEPMPTPLISVGENEVDLEQLDTGVPAPNGVEHDLGELMLDADKLPGYLLIVDSYTLDIPTADDVVAILDRGGTADFAALAGWARDHKDGENIFSAEDRTQVMAAVFDSLKRMRAPPAIGDLQRMMALDRLIEVMATRRDLDRLLKMQRAIKILHAAALLAYDGNLRDESLLGIPLHGMDRLPARSEFLVSPELAMKALRPVVLDRLLELAYDPFDFPNRPKIGALRKSRLQPLASALLAPLQSTDVQGILGAAANPDVAREALRFYLRVRHEAAVEPLVTWLLDHPEAFDDLGKDALEKMPDAVLPPVMRQYIEPDNPQHRPLLRKYIESMPERLRPQVLEILRAVGLDVSPFIGEGGVDVPGALTAFEKVERRLAQRRSAELVQRIADHGIEPATLRDSMRTIARLAQLDPSAIEANAELIIDVLTAAALDEEGPAEQMRALARLDNLPFGTRKDDAARAAEVTRARLEAKAGKPAEALERLEAVDPELAQPQVRKFWIEVMSSTFDQRLEAGQFDLAGALIDTAETLVPGEVDVAELRRRLKWRRYRSAVIVGAIFGLVLLSTIAGLVLRAAMLGLSSWRKSRKEMAKLIRRQEDADASAEEAADFDDQPVESDDDADEPEPKSEPTPEPSAAPTTAALPPELEKPPEDDPPEEEEEYDDPDAELETEAYGESPFDDCFERDGLADVFDAWTDDVDPGGDEDMLAS